MDACEALGGCIIFIDEIDALAPSRGDGDGGGGGIHEASRRMLSVLLQRIEGFQGRSKNILVCATNRKQDLDAALVSRFNVVIRFDLPDHNTRLGLFSAYAKQLPEASVSQLAESSANMSCRAIKDVCEQTERVVASRIISQERSQLKGGDNAVTQRAITTPQQLPYLPSANDYLTQLEKYKSAHMLGGIRGGASI